MRFSQVTLVACLMVLLAILLASPSSGETSNRIESKKMVFDEEANPDKMTTDVKRKNVKADKKDKKADDKEEKSDVKSKKTDGESKMTDGESKKTGGKSKKSKKDKKSKKAKPNGSPKIKSKKSPVNPTGNDKRISSFDASSIAGFVSSITCGELKLNTFKDVDVTRCLCDDKSCPCVMSSRFPCMCTNCEPTPPGGDFFNCLGCSCLEFP